MTGMIVKLETQTRATYRARVWPDGIYQIEATPVLNEPGLTWSIIERNKKPSQLLAIRFLELDGWRLASTRKWEEVEA